MNKPSPSMDRRTFLGSGALGAALAAGRQALGATPCEQAPQAPEANAANPVRRVPELAGPWIQVAHSPALPEIQSPPGQVVDHCFFRATSGKWQLWTQIRDTAIGRLFYRWEGGSEFEHPDWTPSGICWRADRQCGESWDTGSQEFIHAPYVRYDRDRFVMYYGGGPSRHGDAQISIATSPDGMEFTRITDADGNSAAFAGPGYARDAMVLRTGDRYLMYYAADEAGRGVIAVRTASRAYGAQWSDYHIASQGGVCGTNRTSQQCPYVLFLDGYYYLFKMGPSNLFKTAVYRSEDPLFFGKDDDQLVTVLEASAAEVIAVGDRYYLSSLIPGYKGVRVCRLDWVPEA